MGRGKFSSGMSDEQFDKGKVYESDQDAGDVNKGKKTKGGMSLVAGKRSPAHKIMTEIARVLQKEANGSISKDKVSDGKVSKPSSKKQKVDFKKSSKKSIPVGEETSED